MANPATKEKFINWITGLPISLFDAASSVFNPSGANHTIGLVPDPGSSAGTTRFLREDATFAVPPVSGVLVNIQVFNTHGTFTYTPTAGATSAFVIITGGGGGAGGAAASAGAASVGGTGAVTAFLFVASVTSVSVVVGQGGPGGNAGNNPGTDGGQSSFGTTTAAGGLHSAGAPVSANTAGQRGPTTAANATWSVAGGDTYNSNTNDVWLNILGGGSFWGSPTGASAFNVTGATAVIPGCGGGGCGSSGAALAGGAGADGIVVVFEFK